MKTPEQMAEEALSIKEGSDLCLFGESARVFHFADGDYNDDRVKQSDLYHHFHKSLVDLINTVRDQMVQYGLQDKPDLGDHALTNLRWVLSECCNRTHTETLDKLIDWYESRIASLSHEAGIYELLRRAYDEGYQKGKEGRGVSLIKRLFSAIETIEAMNPMKRL